MPPLNDQEIALDDKQSGALDAVAEWYNEGHPEKPWYYLAGYAGTGKTTIAKKFKTLLNTATKFATYTGKAAKVLNSKGCPATTVHSLAYLPMGEIDKEIMELERELADLENPPSINREKKIVERLTELRKPSFILRTKMELGEIGLIILDECFVSGTMIDTPMGPCKIETLRPGDLILNASGCDRIVATSRKEVSRAVKIVCGGSTFTCSENHPFFTEQGLKSASELKSGDRIIQTTAAMRLLRQALQAKNSGSEVQALLQRPLFDALVAAIPGISRKALYAGAECEMWDRPEGVAGFESPMRVEANRANTQAMPFEKAFCSTEDQRELEANQAQRASYSRGQWPWAYYSSGASTFTAYRELGHGISSNNFDKALGDIRVLQARLSKSLAKDRDRSGRDWTPESNRAQTRSKEGENSSFARVDSVEILELGNPELDKFRDAEGKLYLYDLQAEQHSSFSVEGLLVHNCSMIDEFMAADLLSFNIPILVLGDPGQLPPIKGTGYFTSRKPDYLLTEIHRQAADSPVLRLATMARKQERITTGAYGDSLVIGRNKFNKEHALSVSQIIVGSNKARYSMIEEMRSFKGFGGIYPQKDEKMICLRNNKKRGRPILNGQMFTAASEYIVEDIREEQPDGADQYLQHSMLLEDEDGFTARYYIHPECFTRPEVVKSWSYKRRAMMEEFEFGWAITGHKSQGSQWESVVAYADMFHWDRDLYAQWTYTAITRAEKKVILAL